MREHAQSHSSMKLRILSIDAHTPEIFLAFMTKIAHITYSVCQFIVVGNNCTAFYRMKKLGSMKAQRRNIAKIQYTVIIAFYTKSMGSIINDLYSMFFGDCLNCL